MLSWRTTARCAAGSRAAPCAAAPALAAPGGAYSEDVVSGRLRLRQGAGRGAYRFGLDALLLATDLPTDAMRAGAQIVEVSARAAPRSRPLALTSLTRFSRGRSQLGAANGVVALCVATRFPACQARSCRR